MPEYFVLIIRHAFFVVNPYSSPSLKSSSIGMSWRGRGAVLDPKIIEFSNSAEYGVSVQGDFSKLETKMVNNGYKFKA